MQHPARLKVAEELIIPYCNGLITADFEVEVEDAIEPIFRFGDDFQQGIEHVVFIKVQEGTSQAGASRMLEAFNNLLDQLESSILVQVTAGANFSECSNGYTHAIVARLPSEEARDSFSKHAAYVRDITRVGDALDPGVISLKVGYSVHVAYLSFHHSLQRPARDTVLEVLHTFSGNGLQFAVL
ncbi:hypothetical protein CY35_02G002800 [Sphagnum magellanicum]|nr:hypothetical protein CY35_02G002800 [Sphagnum magellanicum]KAH9569668.1 hypothetical protein CY35_02G002800 [Sphagnum magellanicum]KAH9569669.1 hypothetical protein CY35_02G002800 [Sphagnum magellanicum]KAH9569670.1 hypothetical protein CY35_02G002800 [Sphagnum magellanicum]KAH9569686.1 hypothetical protein CY35_02G002800 [Sphagnum magellanicum]